MDIFGIAQAMKGMAYTYFQSARRTGRTVAMVEALKEGDRVAFADHVEAKRVQNMCRERGFEIETVVIDPRQPDKVFERGTAQGRFVFDHSWVEQYYLRAIQQAGEEITYFQNQCSGFGEAHLETKRKAIELAKWNITP
ncbi:MAG: hypothetical protein PVI43_00265 [Candidatus Bathyarchaeota archaeon]|jgi:hypothetical protein